MRPGHEAHAGHGGRNRTARRDAYPAAGPQPPAEPLALADHNVNRGFEVPGHVLEEVGQPVVGLQVNSLGSSPEQVLVRP
jgi:hypothetical protein